MIVPSRRRALVAATSLATLFVLPSPVTRVHAWPRFDWPRARHQAGSASGPAATADEIADYLDEPAAVLALIARLSPESQLAISLFGLTEVTSLPLAGISQTLLTLLTEPAPAILPLLELGLLAVFAEGDSGQIDEFDEILQSEDPCAYSSAFTRPCPGACALPRPQDLLPRASGPISEIREADGLEAVLRLAALWQRLGAEPLRQTQQGVLYKRDRDRIDLDPVLASPIADSFVPLPDSPSLWLALARRVGLIESEAGGDRLLAAPLEFWTENEFHLPQMIATGWLSLPDWCELPPEALAEDDAEAAAVPYLRCALLLWLSTLGDSEWVALDDLAAQLTARCPAWSRLSRSPAAQDDSSPRARPPARARARSRNTAGSRPRETVLLESILLGAAYPLGLVRAAVEAPIGRRVVQLSTFGRYVLAVGPTPPARPAFERFLFVQPNFEVIAYRQGLTPQMVGRLSRFAWWTQIGSALELKLSRESIVFGLDLGSKPEWMLETLSRASQRPLSRGVIEAINHWAERRERVVFYSATTLIEFLTQAERDQAIELWPADGDAAAGSRRGAVPAGRGRSNRSIRPASLDQLARLPPASRRLRHGRARRRDSCARPGPGRPLGGRRAGPVRRSSRTAGPRPRAIRRRAFPPIRDHERLTATGNQPGNDTALVKRMVRAPRREGDPGRRRTPAACEIVPSAEAQSRQDHRCHRALGRGARRIAPASHDPVFPRRGPRSNFRGRRRKPARRLAERARGIENHH